MRLTLRIGGPGLPASPRPKELGLPSRTASVPWSRGDTNLSGQEGPGQRPRAHGGLGGRRCCCLRTAQTPGAPAFPGAPCGPGRRAARKPGPRCPEASCQEHVVGCAQRLAPHLPLCLKGSGAFPHCLLGSQQVLAHFESTFFLVLQRQAPVQRFKWIQWCWWWFPRRTRALKVWCQL